jgi:hypothetical protein
LRMETGHIRLSWIAGVFALAIGDPLTLDARDLHWFRQDVSAHLKKPEPRAPPPVQSRANLEAFISARYPQLTRRKVGGTPVFRVWFDSHGYVARAKLDILSGTPDEIIGSTDLFESVVRPWLATAILGRGHCCNACQHYCRPVRRLGLARTRPRSGQALFPESARDDARVFSTQGLANGLRK